MRTASVILCGGLALLLSGCLGASADPHKGGLFGYSPTAYRQRLAEREDTLSYMQGQNEQLARENADLEKRRSSRSAEVSALEKKDRAMRSELSRLDKTLAASKKSGRADSARLAALQERRNGIEGRMDTASGLRDVEARQRELDGLRKELDALEKEADALSRL